MDKIIPVQLTDEQALKAIEAIKNDRAISAGRFYLPSRQLYEKMSKYADGPTCPKCGKGRIMCEVLHWNLGDTFEFRCYFSKEKCDFLEIMFDEDM